MTDAQRLSAFARNACYTHISELAVEQLKIRVLDTLGVAIATRTAKPPTKPSPNTEAPEANGTASVDPNREIPRPQRPFYDITPSQCFDFGDVYLARRGACHPSDVIGSLLHTADNDDVSGSNFIAAVAVAYQVAIRLEDDAAVAEQGAVGMAPNDVARAAGEAALGQRDIRASAIPSYPTVTSGHPNASNGQPHSPPNTVAPLSHVIDWSKENLESVLRTMTRIHYADILAQPSVDAALTLATPPVFPIQAVRAIRVQTFASAYVALGGGDGTDRNTVSTPSRAARSLPYMVAVALLDHQVQAEQYLPARVSRPDVQALIHKVSISPYAAFTARLPEGMPAQIDAELLDGNRYCTTAPSFRGSTIRPLDWGSACEKFYALATPFVDDQTAEHIARCVHDIQIHRVRDLTALLSKVAPERWRESTVRIG